MDNWFLGSVGEMGQCSENHWGLRDQKQGLGDQKRGWELPRNPWS